MLKGPVIQKWKPLPHDNRVVVRIRMTRIADKTIFFVSEPAWGLSLENQDINELYADVQKALNVDRTIAKWTSFLMVQISPHDWGSLGAIIDVGVGGFLVFPVEIGERRDGTKCHRRIAGWGEGEIVEGLPHEEGVYVKDTPANRKHLDRLKKEIDDAACTVQSFFMDENLEHHLKCKRKIFR